MLKLNADQFVSHVRSLLKALGVYLIASGKFSDSGWSEITGFVLTAAGVLWSQWHHSDDPPSTGAVSSATPSPTLRTASVLPLLALSLSLCLPVGCLVTGCGTTPAKVAYQSESGAQITISAAMTAWGDYVATHHPDADTELKVKQAYEAYQQAAVAAIDATSALSTLTDTNSIPDAQQRVTIAASQAGVALTELTKLLISLGVIKAN